MAGPFDALAAKLLEKKAPNHVTTALLSAVAGAAGGHAGSELAARLGKRIAPDVDASLHNNFGMTTAKEQLHALGEMQEALSLKEWQKAEQGMRDKSPLPEMVNAEKARRHLENQAQHEGTKRAVGGAVGGTLGMLAVPEIRNAIHARRVKALANKLAVGTGVTGAAGVAGAAAYRHKQAALSKEALRPFAGVGGELAEGVKSVGRFFSKAMLPKGTEVAGRAMLAPGVPAGGRAAALAADRGRQVMAPAETFAGHFADVRPALPAATDGGVHYQFAGADGAMQSMHAKPGETIPAGAFAQHPATGEFSHQVTQPMTVPASAAAKPAPPVVAPAPPPPPPPPVHSAPPVTEPGAAAPVHEPAPPTPESGHVAGEPYKSGEFTPLVSEELRPASEQLEKHIGPLFQSMGFGSETMAFARKNWPAIVSLAAPLIGHYGEQIALKRAIMQATEKAVPWAAGGLAAGAGLAVMGNGNHK